eukprot:SAG31_NODE_2195_length_6220_cov_9.014703_7_plen_57_part_00
MNPLVVTLLAEVSANVGLLHTLLPEIQTFLAPIRATVLASRDADLGRQRNFGYRSR